MLEYVYILAVIYGILYKRSVKGKVVSPRNLQLVYIKEETLPQPDTW